MSSIFVQVIREPQGTLLWHSIIKRQAFVAPCVVDYRLHGVVCLPKVANVGWMGGCGWGPGGEELDTKSGRRLLAGRTPQISSVSGILSFLARRPGVAVLNNFGTTKSTCFLPSRPAPVAEARDLFRVH